MSWVAEWSRTLPSGVATASTVSLGDSPLVESMW